MATKKTTTKKASDTAATTDEVKPITAAMADRLVASGMLTPEQRAVYEDKGLIRTRRTDWIDDDTKAKVKKIFEMAQRFNNDHPSMVLNLRLVVAEGEDKKARRITERMLGMASSSKDDE